MMNQLVLINSSRSLYTSSVISFVISLCLILQMHKDYISKTLRAQLNEAQVLLLRECSFLFYLDFFLVNFVQKFEKAFEKLFEFF